MTAFAYSVAPQPIVLRTSLATKLMTPRPVAFEQRTPIEDVAESLRLHALDAAPVVDGFGRLVGVVTAAACEAWEEFTQRSAPSRFAAGKLDSTAVSEITTPTAVSVRDGVSMGEIIERLLHHRARRIYVTNEYDELIGVISMSDILRWLN